MNKFISSLEHITRSKECRVVFNKRGKHIFGGQIENLKIHGFNQFKKIHHIFTIDTSDNLTPVRFSECRFLPLIFPLAYEDATYISYLVTDELELKIISFGGCEIEDPDYFPNNLPSRKAILRPLSYAEKRIYHSAIRKRSYFDQIRMKRLWNGEFFRVAGMIELNKSFGACLKNEKIEDCACSAWKFAEFPATQVPFGDIWNDFSPDIIFEFFICINCYQIHGHLNCT